MNFLRSSYCYIKCVASEIASDCKLNFSIWETNRKEKKKKTLELNDSLGWNHHTRIYLYPSIFLYKHFPPIAKKKLFTFNFYLYFSLLCFCFMCLSCALSKLFCLFHFLCVLCIFIVRFYCELVCCVCSLRPLQLKYQNRCRTESDSLKMQWKTTTNQRRNQVSQQIQILFSLFFFLVSIFISFKWRTKRFILPHEIDTHLGNI